MKALHSLWSEPSFADNPYYMEDFEILTMIISAMTWKKHNGIVKMIADEKILQYLDSFHLLSVYDEVQELIITEKINPKTFWAAGKLFALLQQTEPYVMIDTDFIVWKNIDKFIHSDIVVAHRENFTPVYPDFNYFKMDEKYKFNYGFDRSVLPCNTAFLYIKDGLFKNYYLSESINFMRHCLETENDLCSMVFAEQRLLGMCAEQWSIPVGTLMNESELDIQKSFTHIWGYKEVLRKNNIKKHEFCLKCAERIKKDFPDIIEIFVTIPQISEYFLV